MFDQAPIPVRRARLLELSAYLERWPILPIDYVPESDTDKGFQCTEHYELCLAESALAGNQFAMRLARLDGFSCPLIAEFYSLASDLSL